MEMGRDFRAPAWGILQERSVMGLFVLRRLAVMLLTALALTFVVFYLTNLQPNLEKLARTEGSVRMTDEAVQAWIEQNGHSGSVFARYGQWLGVVPGWTYTDEKGEVRGRCFEIGEDPATAPTYCGLLQGNWGFSTFFKKPVADSLGEKLAATGWLMLAVMLVMVPASLLLGVLSGC
jgi:peptide/nickel transport system permease protein